jgi:hypothetical protein
VVALLALGPLLACGGEPAATDLADPNGRYVEPQPLPAQTTACDTSAGLALVGALFAAVNVQDAGQLAALFPSPGGWSFARSPDGSLVSSGGGIEIRPAPGSSAAAAQALAAGPAALQRLYPDAGAWELTLTPTIDGALASGVTSGTAVDAVSRGQLGAFLDQVSGLHFTVRSEIGGRAAWQEHVMPTGTVRVREVDLGGPFWRATGPRLRSHGRTLVTGGGKVAAYCEGGVLKRVLLSPLVIT